MYALHISFLVLAFSVLLFIIILYSLFLLRFHHKKIENWILAFTLPLFLPYAFCAFLFFLIFFLVSTIDEFPFLLGSVFAVVIVYIYKVVPFLLFVALPSLIRVKKEEILLHTLYSKSTLLFFTNIFIKRDLKNFFIAFFIVFAYVINAYEIPAIVGSSVDKMPALFTYELFHEFSIGSIQKAYASSILYFVGTLFFLPIFYLTYKFTQRVL